MPKRLLLAAAVLAAMVPAMTTPASATTEPHTKAKPTVILVHGAFADASSWTKVVAKLQGAGYPVIAPANPSATSRVTPTTCRASSPPSRAR